MADSPDEKESSAGEGSQSQSQDVSGSTGNLLECPICLQQCQHPVELPCRHVFCFLCIKGVAMQGPNSKCAICRATIPSNVLTNPQLKDVSQLYKDPKSVNGYQWYYESRSGGWWQYDERTMQELERAFSSNQPTCQLLLAGHLYVVDFAQMIQYRSTNRSVFRRIKRGMNLEKRGVAGIRIAGSNTGAGTSGSGSGNNGSSPPPQTSGPITRRRRGNATAPSNTQQQSTSTSAGQGQSTSVSSSPLVPVNPNLSGDSPRDSADHLSDSDDESDEDYNSDYSDVDDDMELGEEEEGLIGDDSDERETEDEEEYEARDGARAPTRRSDRSNSSNNQTPPPPGTAMGNGGVSRTYSPNPSNGRGSRGARGGRSSGGRSGNSNNGSASRSASMGLSDSLSPVLSSHPSASVNSSVLSSLLYNRCHVEEVVIRNNVSNNNYIDSPSPVIGQVSYAVSQTVGNANNDKITFESFEKHRILNQEDFL